MAVADLRRVEADLDGFGVSGAAGRDDVVVGGLRGPSGVARGHGLHTVQLLVDGLDAPEAASREHGDRFAPFGGHLLVELRVWELLGRDHDRKNDRLLTGIPE